MIILILLFMAAAVLYLSIATAWLIMTGNWKWTEDIRRNTFRIWNAGMGMAVVGATFIWGIGGAIGAWPIWLLCAVVFVGATALQDLWAGIGWFKHNKPERTITHKDGSQAVVDSQDKGYRRIQRREM
jgi:hypothetical protein